MANDLVELTETDEKFTARSRECEVSISKRWKSAEADFPEFSMYCDSKNVAGFHISAGKGPAELYFSWTDGGIREKRLGHVDNPKHAQEWIDKVNIMYH